LDVKPCPPTPKRIRRNASNAELDMPMTLLSFASKEAKTRCNCFLWEKTIGSGAHNEGWRVISKDTGDKSAILKSKQPLATMKERRAMLDSFKNLNSLVINGTWHPHIVPHYCVWQEKGRLFVQTELCEKGDLGRLLDQKAERGMLSEADIWEVIKQILPTLHFMHSRGVLHLDLKPANIYVTRDNVMKIGDFGTSVCRERWVEERDLHEGDAAYLAVEVLRDHFLSPAADIFSFGMTLHRLVTGYCVPTSSGPDKSCYLKKAKVRYLGTFIAPYNVHA